MNTKIYFVLFSLILTIQSCVPNEPEIIGHKNKVAIIDSASVNEDPVSILENSSTDKKPGLILPGKYELLSKGKRTGNTREIENITVVTLLKVMDMNASKISGLPPCEWANDIYAVFAGDTIFATGDNIFTPIKICPKLQLKSEVADLILASDFKRKSFESGNVTGCDEKNYLFVYSITSGFSFVNSSTKTSEHASLDNSDTNVENIDDATPLNDTILVNITSKQQEANTTRKLKIFRSGVEWQSKNIN